MNHLNEDGQFTPNQENFAWYYQAKWWLGHEKENEDRQKYLRLTPKELMIRFGITFFWLFGHSCGCDLAA